MTFLPKTLFGRLLLMATLTLGLTVFLMRGVVTFVINETGGHILGEISNGLLTLTEYNVLQQKPEDTLKLFEKIQSQTSLIFIPNADEMWDPLPNLPTILAWQKNLEAYHANSQLRYQTTPHHILWLIHTQKPQFSIGLPLQKPLDRMVYYLWFYLILLFVSIPATYVFTRYLITPLKDLVKAAHDLGKNISVININPTGPEEIKAVTIAINTMSQNLMRTIKEQEFLLGSISHDLRTPLTRIRLATELMSTESEDLVTGITDDIAEINSVLQRFIELAKLNIEESEPWATGNLHDLINEVSAKYQRANIPIKVILSEGDKVRYKISALRRFLYNVIDNSIKYGGGDITIRTYYQNQQLELRLFDQGNGFSNTTDRLYSPQDDIKSQDASHGLGLLIIQRIAKMHNAEVTFRNRPEGGAETTLRLRTVKSEC